MARIQLTREYNVSRSQLFAYVTDPERWVDWYNNCIAVTDSNGWTKPGDQAQLEFRLLGRDVPVRMELQEYAVDTHTMVHVSAKGVPDVTQQWDLSSTPDGTEVSVTLTTEEATTFFNKVIDRFLLPKTVEKDLARSLDNLEDLVGIGL